MSHAHILVLVALLAACARGAAPAPSPAELPRTRAERTGYTETSTYADVLAFLDSLQRLHVPFARHELGVTTEGRHLPLVVLSRPQVSTPEEARRLDRPIVYVQANIHAGEVEGKEAMQAMIRDLATASAPNVLDSIVLIVVPIYNADGNERFASQSVNRTEQRGPEQVGQRPNAMDLDLNRDYVKAEAPETRASLAAFEAWDPDLFVDLHTTDGSFHGYALTYAPSLNPAALWGNPFARDVLLPELRRRVRARDGFELFDYGNFDAVYEERDLADSAKRGWYTYDHRPRFGTNYYGLRGRTSILSEAYSHDPFERRVRSTYAFVREILSLVAERAADFRRLRHTADSSVVAWGGAPSADVRIPIRSTLTTDPHLDDVRVEVLERTGDSSRTEPGVPPGLRRTGRIIVERMPVYDRFVPTLTQSMPGGWVLPAGDTAAIRLLRLHGVRVERIDAPWPAAVSAFAVDSTIHADRPFQGHHELHLVGHWGEPSVRTVPAGAWLVPAAQRLAILAMYLLEPESDDGLATWNVFDAEVGAGKEFPVVRVTTTSAATRTTGSAR